MPGKARVVFRRWFHHRTRSEYRELTEDNEKFLSDKIKDWTTVPGLIVEDDEGFLSVEDDDAYSHSPQVKKDGRLAIDDEPIADMHGVVQRLSGSQSFETLETEEESELADHEQSVKRQRAIRWADHEHKTFVVRHIVEILPHLNVRIVVLMLHPGEKIFEFVQCELQTDERLKVSDLLVQLPSMASMDSLKNQRYSALYRGDREMVNILSIQDFDIVEGEILVAIASAANPKQSIAAAAALLQQRSLLRAVQRAKLSGRALQKLTSSAELEAVLEDAGTPNQEPKFDEDDESRDECRLVLRVLSRELGVQPSHPDDRESSSDDEDDEDEEPNRTDGFPHVPVPELEDQEFHLFQEATIDPYSPVVRGRMADVPRTFLSDEIGLFKPPFRTCETDNILWDEISSDDEIVEVESLTVDNLALPEEEGNEEELHEKAEDDTGMTPCSEESGTDDEGEECIDAHREIEEGDLSTCITSETFSVESTRAPDLGETEHTDSSFDLFITSEDSELLQAMSEELEPVPRIGCDRGESDESPGLPDREICELSHISEVDTLEESDDITTALTLSLQESDEISGTLFNIPQIKSREEGEDASANRRAEEYARSFEDKAIYDASALCMAVALLIGSVSKISLPKAVRSRPEPLEMEEAEV